MKRITPVVLAAVLALTSLSASSQSPLHGTYVMQLVPSQGWPDAPTTESFANDFNLHAIEDTPYLASATSTPMDELVEAGIIEKPRLLYFYNSAIDTSRFEVIEYIPLTTPTYAFNAFAYHAAECDEADYFRMRVLPADIDSIVAITQMRPNYDEEIWYYSISNVGSFSNQTCVQHVFDSNAELASMESFAQFTANIIGQEYFPWILDAPESVRSWQYPSSAFDNYALADVAPPVSCTGDYQPDAFWTCEVQIVGCPDLNGDDYVDMDDLLEFLPVYDTPIDCDSNEEGDE